MNTTLYTMSIKKIIEEQQKIELNGKELMRLTEYRINILPYEELVDYDNLDSIFNPHSAVIILYQDTVDNGHWIALLKHNNIIEYFDPYGKNADYYIDNGIIKYNKTPYLSALIQQHINNGGQYVYNNIPLQKKSNNISTCGRWCAVRIKFKYLDIETFNKLFSKETNKDLYIILMTLIFTI